MNCKSTDRARSVLKKPLLLAGALLLIAVVTGCKDSGLVAATNGASVNLQPKLFSTMQLSMNHNETFLCREIEATHVAEALFGKHE